MFEIYDLQADPAETRAITDAPRQPSAGGESIFGRQGFAELPSPAERFENGFIRVPDAPGPGHKLNEVLVKKYGA